MRSTDCLIIAAAASVAAAFAPVASAVPLYEANAGASATGTCNTDLPGSAQGQLGPSPISAHQICAGSGLAEGRANASPGTVGASSSAVSSGGVFGQGALSESNAAYRETAVVFSANRAIFPGDIAPVAMRLGINGFINATSGADAQVTFTVQTDISGGFSRFFIEADGGAPQNCSSFQITSFPDCSATLNGVLVTNLLEVPLNREILVQLSVHTIAGATPGGEGSSNSAHADFADTFGFDAVPFVLPEGVTANAPDSFIFDDRFLPASAPSALPEPSTTFDLGAGLLLLACFGARPRRRS